MTQDKSTARKTTQTSSRGNSKSSKGFSDDEKAAMKERAKELKAEQDRAEGENAVLEKIAEMGEPDRSIAQRVHAIITASVPELSAKTWYGMPAYAKDGNIVCFYQPAEKFKARFAMLGFSDAANLDDGAMWPVYYALKELTPVGEAKIAALVKKSVS